MQGSLGELQKLQPGCRCLRCDACLGGDLVPLSGNKSSGNRGWICQRDEHGKEEQLKDEVEDAMKKLASDVDLFGEEVDAQPQQLKEMKHVWNKTCGELTARDLNKRLHICVNAVSEQLMCIVVILASACVQEDTCC